MECSTPGPMLLHLSPTSRNRPPHGLETLNSTLDHDFSADRHRASLPTEASEIMTLDGTGGGSFHLIPLSNNNFAMETTQMSMAPRALLQNEIPLTWFAPLTPCERVLQRVRWYYENYYFSSEPWTNWLKVRTWRKSLVDPSQRDQRNLSRTYDHPFILSHRVVGFIGCLHAGTEGFFAVKSCIHQPRTTTRTASIFHHIFTDIGLVSNIRPSP